MSLENLAKIDQLVRHEVSFEEIQRILAAAERNLTDAMATNITVENRFDAAYKAIMQCAMAALWAKGYRTSTSKPGHHQTAIQTLTKTLGVDAGTVIVLDALRKQRNLNDYTGDTVTEAILAGCIEHAHALIDLAQRSLLST